MPFYILHTCSRLGRTAVSGVLSQFNILKSTQLVALQVVWRVLSSVATTAKNLEDFYHENTLDSGKKKRTNMIIEHRKYLILFRCLNLVTKLDNCS